MFMDGDFALKRYASSAFHLLCERTLCLNSCEQIESHNHYAWVALRLAHTHTHTHSMRRCHFQSSHRRTRRSRMRINLSELRNQFMHNWKTGLVEIWQKQTNLDNLLLMLLLLRWVARVATQFSDKKGSSEKGMCLPSASIILTIFLCYTSICIDPNFIIGFWMAAEHL